MPSLSVCVPFPYSVWGRIWSSIYRFLVIARSSTLDNYMHGRPTDVSWISTTLWKPFFLSSKCSMSLLLFSKLSSILHVFLAVSYRLNFFPFHGLTICWNCTNIESFASKESSITHGKINMFVDIKQTGIKFKFCFILTFFILSNRLDKHV